MNRREFLRAAATLGLAAPASQLLAACGGEARSASEIGKVIIVGAGAAGMSTGYLLDQLGVDYEILEASDAHGGRIKRNNEFVDFPVPLGAEWIHVDPEILAEAVNDDSVSIDIETTKYDADEVTALYEGEELSLSQFGLDEDSKFVGSTWFDFFEQYIFPTVSSKISYGVVVNVVDYSGERVEVIAGTETYVADQVVVAAPVKLLQNRTIGFVPDLPSEKQDAINNVTVWDGCKAFIEFETQFYPTFVGFDIQPASDGQKMYYDAAYGQKSDANVLGLFAVGAGTKPYVELEDDALVDYILAELDELFDGAATPNYIQHVFQNWNKEPFAKGAYIYDAEDWQRVRTLGKSVNSKLFFAGDAYTTGSDWSSVHTAIRSARRAVEEITSA